MFTDRFLKVQALHIIGEGEARIIDLRLNPFMIEAYTDHRVVYDNEAGMELEVPAVFVYTKFGEFEVLETIDDFEKLLNDR
jgi:hypothetical protein